MMARVRYLNVYQVLRIWNFQFFLLRFLDGVADAASWCAGVSILMKLFPNKVSQIMSWTEMLFGLGYMLGKY